MARKKPKNEKEFKEWLNSLIQEVKKETNKEVVK